MSNRMAWTPFLLRFLRMKKQWSLHEACVAFKSKYPEVEAKMSRNQLLEYELGKSTPRADRLAQLCELFECNPGFLFTTSKEELVARMEGHYDTVIGSIRKRGTTPGIKRVIPKEA